LFNADNADNYQFDLKVLDSPVERLTTPLPPMLGKTASGSVGLSAFQESMSHTLLVLRYTALMRAY